MYSRSNKKQNILINFNRNYHREMKDVPINMYYCLLQFDALNSFRDPSLWGSLLKFDYFNVALQNLTAKSQSSQLKLPRYIFSHF